MCQFCLDASNEFSVLTVFLFSPSEEETLRALSSSPAMPVRKGDTLYYQATLMDAQTEPAALMTLI